MSEAVQLKETVQLTIFLGEVRISYTLSFKHAEEMIKDLQTPVNKYDPDWREWAREIDPLIIAFKRI